MIPTPLLLLSVGVRVEVLGEGRLRFAAGRDLAFASTATLTANAAGLLSDRAGRPVLPQIHLSGSAFAISMNGTVTVAGRYVGRLVLQRPNGEIGFPGEGTFGIVQSGGGGRPQATTRPATEPDASSLVVITVRPRSEVEGDRVLLRDVADLSGEPGAAARLGRIDVADTPLLGGRRSISRWGLVAALRDAGLPDGAYSIQPFRDATVARKGQTIDARTLIDAATAEAKRLANGAEPTLLPGASISPVIAPLGTLRIESATHSNGDRLEITVVAYVDGKPVCDRSFGFKVKLDGVRMGDAVRVAVASGNAVIETDAKAKTAGNLGDTIQIVTADGTVLTATVTGTGKAEIKL